MIFLALRSDDRQTLSLRHILYLTYQLRQDRPVRLEVRSSKRIRPIVVRRRIRILPIMSRLVSLPNFAGQGLSVRRDGLAPRQRLI
jgi:hypothetical protein